MQNKKNEASSAKKHELSKDLKYENYSAYKNLLTASKTKKE